MTTKVTSYEDTNRIHKNLYIQQMKKNKKNTILIVEDTPEIMYPFVELLSDRYTVITVTKGKIAIEKIKSNQQDIDVVILDYKLPDISGLNVLREIKKIKPDVPVIVMTAYGDENIAVEAFRHGARDYIKKPFNYNELINKIEFSLKLKSVDKSQERRVLTDNTEQFTASLLYELNSLSISYNLQRGIKYINDNYMNKMSLETVARKAGMSKYHFSREFKKSVGYNYIDYLNKIRIERAKDLLKDPNLSITEVAFSVGYSDLSNFERTFKKRSGCNPLQYKHAHVCPK